MLKHFAHFRIQETAGEPRYFCGIYDVTQDIRSQKVIDIVSAVAMILPRPRGALEGPARFCGPR